MSELFHPSVVKREVAKRGVISSKDWNDFMDSVVSDFSRVSTALNSLSNKYELKVLELEEERRKLLSLSESVLEQKRLEDAHKAVLNETIRYYQTFRSLRDLDYTGISTTNILRIEPVYGQVTLPYNRCVARFASKNPANDGLTLPSSTAIDVVAVSEALGDVIAGTPEQCIDAKSGTPWIRKVIFPMEDDQASVTMDVTITVPTVFAADANVLTIIPSPAGQVDVLDVQYSTTTAAPSIALPGFVAENDVGAIRIHFTDLSITKIKIRLRQRHFVFEEAEKVFMYGLKEVGLYLVEFEKTATGHTTPTSMIQFAVTAPDGYKYNQIKSFVSDPDFATGGNPNGIYYRIYGDAARTSLLWRSYSDPMPTSGSPWSILSSAVSTIYVVLYLDYDTVNEITPVPTNFYMDYTVTAI